MTKIHDTFLADRAVFYGISVSDFSKPGTTFRVVESLTGKNMIYQTVIDRRTFISTGSDHLEALRKLSDQGQRGLSEDLLRSFAPTLETDDVFSNLIHRGGPMRQVALPDGFEIVAMHPDHHPPLQAFLDLCTKEDIDDAEIYLDDPDEEIRMIYRGDEPVAYAGYRVWESGLGDTGILVLPEYRRRGFAVAAVAAVTLAGLERGRVPLYRVSVSNKGSLATSLACGYELQFNTVVYKW